MTKNETLRFTETERIEFDRRCDIARASADSAVKIMAKQKLLKVASAALSKNIRSYWYWVFVFAGSVIYWQLTDERHNLNLGLIVLVGTCLIWFSKQIDFKRVQVEIDTCASQLYGYEATWASAVGDSEGYWMLEQLQSEWKIDWECEDANRLWSSQIGKLLVRACGVDRGSEMARQWQILKLHETQKKADEA